MNWNRDSSSAVRAAKDYLYQLSSDLVGLSNVKHSSPSIDPMQDRTTIVSTTWWAGSSTKLYRADDIQFLDEEKII